MYYNIAYFQYRTAILQYNRYTIISVLPSYIFIIFGFSDSVNTFDDVVSASFSHFSLTFRMNSGQRNTSGAISCLHKTCPVMESETL